MTKTLEITKEQLEKIIGCKIQDFRLDPLYDEDVCIGLDISIFPTTVVDCIDFKGFLISDKEDKCKELGIEGNYKLLQYLEGLEQTVERLKNELHLI